jgi:hypothetical protein
VDYVEWNSFKYSERSMGTFAEFRAALTCELSGVVTVPYPVSGSHVTRQRPMVLIVSERWLSAAAKFCGTGAGSRALMVANNSFILATNLAQIDSFNCER